MKISWVTGARGFIGRNLAAHLAAHGYRVAGIGHGAWPVSDASRWGVSHWLNSDVSTANLGRLQTLAGAPDVIFHLAGGSAVGPSFHNPLEDFHRTAGTTAQLLEWVRTEQPSARVVCASSAAVYGRGHTGPILEETPVTPFSPYGYHKAVMEMVAASYRENFGLQVSTLRLFSVYGAGLEKQLLWDMCGKLLRNESAVVLGGTGDEIRDWLHVSDAVRLLQIVAESTAVSGSVVNGGTGVGVSVREISDLVRSEWGSGASLSFTGERRAGDPDSLIADVTRARALGFLPKTDLRQGVADVVQWFRKQKAN
jgi:UDP-glucose 4-epimerase